MPGQTWTEAEDGKVAALLREGFSMSKIGAVLHKTRNAVVGRVHRNKDLQALITHHNGNPARQKRAAVQKTSPRRPAAAVPARPAPPSPVAPVLPPPAAPEMRLMPLLETGSSACKYPVEEDRAIVGHILCCGATIACEGASYCAYHRALCVAGPPSASSERLH